MSDLLAESWVLVLVLGKNGVGREMRGELGGKWGKCEREVNGESVKVLPTNL